MSGWIAEFASIELALAAACALRERSTGRVELYSPYDPEGAETALATKRPRAPARLVLGGGVLGAVVAYAIQWYTTVIGYPLNVGGRPLHSAPAFIPIVFETAVLLGAVAAFFGFFAFCGLPRLWQPVFEVEGFESTTRDGFWVSLRTQGAAEESRSLLASLGALRILPFEVAS